LKQYFVKFDEILLQKINSDSMADLFHALICWLQSAVSDRALCYYIYSRIAAFIHSFID